MKIRHLFAASAGKFSRWILQTFFKGGSSYPGKLALKLDPKILDYLIPNKIIVLDKGQIKTTGDSHLLKQILTSGFNS